MMDVEKLLETQQITYKIAGKDILIRCLNPEHEDIHPSLRIDRLTGIFNCLSCGFSGNIFTHFGEHIDLVQLEVLKVRKKIEGVLKNDYILPMGREPFLRQYRGISKDTFATFDAFLHPDYEGRICFPIYDNAGKLVGIIGRYAFSDADPKYKIDPPGVSFPLYPTDAAIEKDSIILVEGIFDMLNLWDKGLRNVVCAFGKSLGETKKKAKRAEVLQKFIPLKLRGVKKVYILFDDGAQASAKKLANLIGELFIVEVVDSPLIKGDKDPGNLTKDEVDRLKEELYEENSNSR